MRTLLDNLELDIQELKCLMQALDTADNPALRSVVRRNIRQMQERLEELARQVEAPVHTPSPSPVSPPVEPQHPVEAVAPTGDAVAAETVADLCRSGRPAETVALGERIRPAADLRQGISLNDSFRFTRELFDGSGLRMNELIARLQQATSLNQAIELFRNEVHPAEGNEAAADFEELLKKYFS